MNISKIRAFNALIILSGLLVVTLWTVSSNDPDGYFDYISSAPVQIQDDLIGKNEAILTFKESPNPEILRSLSIWYDASISLVGQTSSATYVMHLDSPITLQTLQLLKQHSNLLSVETNSDIRLADLPNDEYLDTDNQWNLFGESSVPPAKGVGADTSWENGYAGVPEVVVAVIDTGIQINHPDLSDNIWVNIEESNGTAGVDDDNNGFIDDMNGWDFVHENSSLFDVGESSHGTHVAGIIAATTNNSIGVAGIAHQTTVLPIKALTKDGGQTVDVIEAIDYVTMLRTEKNVNIVAINASWGSSLSSRALLAAIKRAGDAGILFVSAAGNSARDLNLRRFFPASYDCRTSIRDWDCNIAVSATARSGEISSSYSNYGVNAVEIAAPGSGILSTIPTDSYGVLTGTSMAAPHVSAAIALCAGAYQGTNVGDRNRLLFELAATSNDISEYVTYGRLDVRNLGSSCDSLSESFAGQYSNLTAEAIYTDVINLRWSDNVTGEFGTEIQIAEGGCQSEFQHQAYIGPGLTTYRVSGLKESTFYCFRIRAFKEESRTLWTQSNLAVTWTTNLPFVYGYVTSEDGSPIENAQVNWKQDVVSNSQTLTTYSSADGFYAIQVSPGSGALWVSSLPHHSSVGVRGQVFSSPVIPMGLKAGGKLSLENDTQIDIALPPMVDVTFKVTDETTGLPVAGARLYGAFSSGLCNGSKDVYKDDVPKAYKPWPDAQDGAVSAYCEFGPFGSAKTDENGELHISVVHHDLYLKSYKGLIQFPNDKTRVKPFEFTADENKVINISIPTAETLAGQVVTFDGQPVGNVKVEWVPSIASRDNLRQFVYTDANGNYSFQSTLSLGYLTVITPPIHKSAQGANNYIYPTVDLPVGLKASGSFTFNGINAPTLTLPPTYETRFEVKDALTNLPIANARVEGVNSSMLCNNRPDVWNDAITRAYLPFPGAGEGDQVNANCEFVPFESARTDSNGIVTFQLIQDWLFYREYRGSVIVNGQLARAEAFAFRADDSQLIDISIDAPHLLSGKVLSANGESVGSIRVNWKPTAGSEIDIVHTYTDSLGNYSLEVSQGEGTLWVSTPTIHKSMAEVADIFPSIKLPTGLKAGGSTTITGDTSIDLTLPPVVTKTFTAVDAYTNEPVANAEITSASGSLDCNGDPERFNDSKPRIYLPFPGALDGFGMTANCGFQPFHRAETNNVGSVELTFIRDDLYQRDYSFGVIHPMQTARVGKKVFRATSNTAETIVIPGTPSQPKWSSTLVSEESVTLSWDEPWDGAAYIDYYNVHVALDLNGPYTLVNQGSCSGNIASTSRTCVVEGLTPGVRYFFIVVAHNEVGYSEPSSATSVMSLKEALVPILGVVTKNPFGFRVVVENYDPTYQWTVQSTLGNVSISTEGLVEVTGLTPGATSEITVTSSRDDSHAGSVSMSFRSLDKKIEKIATGLSHTCAITTDGDLWCWGANKNGQLGTGNTTSSTVPLRVMRDKKFTDIAIGDNFTCGISDSKVWCWGGNNSGQLGDGTTKQKIAPALVKVDTDTIRISANKAHACLLSTNQTVWCWGNNARGQLGDGTTKQRTTPTQVKNLTGITTITTGTNHTCALGTTLWCWGNNARGQLGDGTKVNRSLPTNTVYIGVVEFLMAGGEQTFVTSFDGDLIAWGQNSSGQLGDGTTLSKISPTRIQTFW